MGVKGLQSLLTQNRDKFASKEKLRDTNLVIDCNNLQHFILERIFNREKRPHFRADRYGCNLKEYARVVDDFFHNLQLCGVTPILVVDGSITGKGDFTGLDESRQKLLIKRGHEYMLFAEKVETLQKGKGNLLIPRLFKVIFREVVRRRAIETHQVAYEANHLSARLANELDCPVLAGDSDFIIYPINKGFIIVEHFYCRKSQHGDFIECDVFHQQKFIAAFAGLRAECLPMLNVMLGKNSLEMETFEDLVGPIVEEGDLGVKLTAKRDDQKKIVRLLMWLKDRSREEALKFILDKVDDEIRHERQKFCNNLINVYNFQGAGDISTELERIYPSNQQVEDGELPAKYLLKLFNQHDLTGPCLNIILGKPDHDFSFLSDFSQPSPYKLEFRIFSVVMALLRPKSVEKMMDEDSYELEKQVFQVYTRKNQDENQPEYGSFDIKPIDYLEGFGSLNHLDCYSMTRLDEEQKRLLITKTFRYTKPELVEMTDLISTLYLRLDIPLEAAHCMMLVKYIAIETDTAIDESFVASLLLVFFYWARGEKAVDQEIIPAHSCFQLYGKILSLDGVTNSKDLDKPDVYRPLVHSIVSLQATYHAYFMLVNLLVVCDHELRPDLWFDGHLLFRLMSELHTVGLHDFLTCAPIFRKLVDEVLAILTNADGLRKPKDYDGQQ